MGLLKPVARVSVVSVAAGLLASVMFAALPASPQTADPTATDTPPPSLSLSAGVLVPDPGLQPGVALVRVRGAAYDRAITAYDTALAERVATTVALADAQSALVTAVADRDSARVAVDAGRAAQRDQVGVLVAVERAVRELAVASYTSTGGSDDPVLYILEGGLPGPEVQRQLTQESTEFQFGKRQRLADQLEATEAQLAADLSVLADRARAIVDVTATVEELMISLFQLELALIDRADDVVRARRTATVAGVDVSLVALDAYVAAANNIRVTDPGCGLEWWMLAGIGRIESRHGTIRGGGLRSDGRPASTIIGIRLDGTHGTRLIADTDGGRLDSDSTYDRAVGPMQFIPSTWATFSGDGNGDGRADPHNVYDAALAAATYLCREGGTLNSAGLATAYFAYNNSATYVADVTRHAARYRSSVVIPVIPPAPPPPPPDVPAVGDA